MDFSLEFGNFWSSRAQAFVVGMNEEHKGFVQPRFQAVLKKAKEKKLFSGKENETYVFENVVFVGLGPSSSPASFAKAVGSAWPKLKSLGVDSCAVLAESSQRVYDTVLGLEAASYTFDQFKKERNSLAMKALIYTKDHEAASSLKKAKVISKAIALARDLANQPSNIATPEFMAQEARKTAKEAGLSVRVMNEKTLQKEKFGALLAVGQGSEHTPRLVVIEHLFDRKKPWLAFVGKGITFDSGGISIKPSADMDKMKFDKAGACAVLAAMTALKQLKVSVNVVAVLPFAENLPSGKAYKPGDVVTSYAGKTIEVLNTDAEGRLILADALSYALKTYKPTAIVDLATLTGACVVALGEVYAGLFSNKPELLSTLQVFSEKADDRCWPLPLSKEYEEKVKGEIADIKNIGDWKGYAGAITGAAFLKQFLDQTPWVHLDIAGVAWNTTPKPYLGVGATGFGVKLLVALAEEHKLFNPKKEQ